MKNLIILFFCFNAATTTAEEVHIPDANFKKYLLEHKKINLNGDSEISLEEAKGFKGKLACSDMGIRDMTGLSSFTSITKLRCTYNELTKLDLSKNTELIWLI